jgi:DNA-binding beta-propeller fold protein YncE
MNTPTALSIGSVSPGSLRIRALTSIGRIASPLCIIGIGLLASFTVSRASEAAHEVWMLDQSNTYDSNGSGTLDSGGTLYIFDGNALAGQAASKAAPEIIDLGGAVASWIFAQTASFPVRPHYITFNASSTHAIISFVGTGHVMIIEAATRTPVFVIDVGVQAHAAVPSPDESYILVANQNGKLLQRITTNYATNTFALDGAATLDLAAGNTPSGALKQDPFLRPDNAPILALPDATSTLGFVTLRGGGLFVVNARSTPMAIVAEYTASAIDPAGLLAIQAGNKLYFNSGGGGGATLGHQSVLYTLPVNAFSTVPILTPNTPAPVTVFDHQSLGNVDSHGLLLTKHDGYLWVADRAANSLVVVDPGTDLVVNEIELAGNVSSDPAPDLLDISPAGNRAYVTLRGPNPLTGNNPDVNNAKGLTPGLGVVHVTHSGLAGKLKAVFRISNMDAGGTERADPHGLAVRRR